MRMDRLGYLDKTGADIGPMIDINGRVIRLSQDAPSPKGASWWLGNQQIELSFDSWIDMYPTPEHDGLVVIFPKDDATPFQYPDNAAIYNADGSLRFRLRAPKPLSRHWPGYVHTAEQIEKRPPEGFWQVGWNVNDFGALCAWEAPYLMWANIGLHCDVYERRYFDPKTGEFDLEHYSTARR